MTQLYVGNLSAEGDEKAIRALFGKYGQVREVLMKNGYAFVEFESPIAAEDAMRELNGKCVSSCTVRLYIRLSHSVCLPWGVCMGFVIIRTISTKCLIARSTSIMYWNKSSTWKVFIASPGDGGCM